LQWTFFKGICIVLFFLGVSIASGTNIKDKLKSASAWVPVDWHTLPKANPDDKIEILYLVAPLLEGQYGPLFGYFDLFHGAIALKNVNQNTAITINYDAINFFHSSVFPYVYTLPNGTRYLEWQNGGANFIYLGINETYWTKTNEVVAITTGDVYNKFINTWNAQINATQPYYDMFSILDHYEGTLYVDGWDCFDFAVNSLQVLYEYGAEFTAQGPIGKDDVNVYTSIVPENMTEQFNNDPAVKETIIDFFELIQAQANNMSIFEIAMVVFETFEGDWYVFERTDYWRIELTWPFFGLDFVNYTLPGQQSFVDFDTPKIIPSPLIKIQ
jgi:hypothetical protein